MLIWLPNIYRYKYELVPPNNALFCKNILLDNEEKVQEWGKGSLYNA